MINHKHKFLYTHYPKCAGTCVRKYLIEYNGDHISVIKKYMGVEKKVEKPIKSINQEIYKQIRTQLDTSMKEYNALQEKKLEEEFMIKTTTE